MTVLYIALMIGGLIFVHELGHYLFARWLGVHVVEFSIGFGPKIAGFKGKQRHPHLPPTEYILSALPVGGYVRMLGADPSEEIAPETRDVALNFKPVWRRFLIALAGPVFNLLLPILLFFSVGLSVDQTLPSVIGTVDPGGPADRAGIRPGDRIVEVAGEPVRYFSEDMARAIEDHPGVEIDIAWERLGALQRARITPRAEERDIIPNVLTQRKGRIGVGASFALPIIAVADGSPAALAGLRTWDRVVTVDGQPEPYLHRVLARIAAAPDRPVALGVIRHTPSEVSNLTLALGAPHVITLPPAAPGAAPDRGVSSGECVVHRLVPGSPAAASGQIAPGDRLVAIDGAPCTSWVFADYALRAKKKAPVTLTFTRGAAPPTTVTLAAAEVPWPLDLNPDHKVLIHGLETLFAIADPDPIDVDNSLTYALAYTVRNTSHALIGTAAALGGLFSGDIGLKEGLGGPVLIAQLTTRAAEQGWEQFLNLMAVLSVSLGLINLLPIPILDGGTLLFLAIEGVRRKPVSMRARMIATYIGLAFIVILMVIVFRNDLDRCSGLIARLPW